MDREKVKRIFREYFQSQGFNWRDTAPLCTPNPKLLFHISGGVVFEDIIESGATPRIARVVSIQRCLRTDNWNKVGTSGKHHLFFEMLGHFSFYEQGEFETKHLMIKSAWEFLTKVIHLSPSRFIITVHPQDRISKEIWESLNPGKIVKKQNNTNVSPHRKKSGLRSEIIWDKDKNFSVYGRYVELWNIVFTQYDNPDFRGPVMRKIAADSGMSLERLLMAIEDQPSDYHCSIWRPIIAAIQSQTSIVLKEKTAFRIADMLRAVVALLAEGVLPGNKAENYVTRRIIREMIMLCRKVQLPINRLTEAVKIISLEVGGDSDLIHALIEEEHVRFLRCLQRGEAACAKLLNRNQGHLSEDEIRFLKETYGYPPELSRQQQVKWRANMQ